jgi:hypothetical protein
MQDSRAAEKHVAQLLLPEKATLKINWHGFRCWKAYGTKLKKSFFNSLPRPHPVLWQKPGWVDPDLGIFRLGLQNTVSARHGAPGRIPEYRW